MSRSPAETTMTTAGRGHNPFDTRGASSSEETRHPRGTAAGDIARRHVAGGALNAIPARRRSSRSVASD